MTTFSNMDSSAEEGRLQPLSQLCETDFQIDLNTIFGSTTNQSSLDTSSFNVAPFMSDTATILLELVNNSDRAVAAAAAAATTLQENGQISTSDNSTQTTSLAAVWSPQLSGNDATDEVLNSNIPHTLHTSRDIQLGLCPTPPSLWTNNHSPASYLPSGEVSPHTSAFGTPMHISDSSVAGGSQASLSSQNDAPHTRLPLPSLSPILPLSESEASHYDKIRWGRGSFSVVFRAKDKRNGDESAMKRMDMRKIEAASDIAAVDACRKEISLLQRLSHPHIIKYFRHFEEDERLYLLLEFAESDLQKVINTYKRNEEDGIPPVQVFEYFSQLCDAVQYLHRLCIVHRDIKPANVFLVNGTHVRLGDFGAAKQLPYATARETTMAGTPYYAAPEMFQGHGYGLEVDIWAMGCILYQLIALERPFEIDRRDSLGIPAQALLQLKQKICTGSYRPLNTLCSHENVETLVDSCLRVHPSRRPKAVQLRDISRKILRDLKNFGKRPFPAYLAWNISTVKPTTINATSTPSHVLPPTYVPGRQSAPNALHVNRLSTVSASSIPGIRGRTQSSEHVSSRPGPYESRPPRPTSVPGHPAHLYTRPKLSRSIPTLTSSKAQRSQYTMGCPPPGSYSAA